MNELVKAAVDILDYLILGAMVFGLFVLILLIIWDSEIASVLRIRFYELRHERSTLSQMFLLSLIAGSMYFCGAIMSNASYALLERAHFRIIETTKRIYTDTSCRKEPGYPSARPIPSELAGSPEWGFYALPVPILNNLNKLTEIDYDSFTNDFGKQMNWGAK